MPLISDITFAVVALFHLWFLILEMFLWEKPLGRKTFGQSREQAAQSAVLAANQGLYNGFLSAGLIWGLIEGHSEIGFRVRLFFGLCVIVAGVYGAYSTRKRAILFIQAAPAMLAVALLLLSR